MKKCAILLAFVIFFSPVRTGLTQSVQDLNEIEEEVRLLMQNQSSIKKELQEIKNLLGIKQVKPEPEVIVREVEPDYKDKVINIDHRPFKGSKNSKVILVEVSDYQCNFCGQFAREVLPQINSEYIKTGKIGYVFFDYPIEAIHQNALKAALAANCAGDQGKYWEMHDRLFEDQNALDPGNLLRFAETVGLEMAEFKKCFDGEQYTAEIHKEIEEARKMGIRTVPTFLLGHIDSEANVKVVKSLRGAKRYSDYKEMIESVLSASKE